MVNLIYRGAFLAAFIVSYWMTNVLGFVLLQKGLEGVLKNSKEKKKYLWKNFLRDVLLSLAYTLLIILLVRFRIIKPVI